MRSGILLLLSALFLCTVPSCEKAGAQSDNVRSYSSCPIAVKTGFDYANQVDYSFSGYGITNYSLSTVCFRRIKQDGYAKTYDEIMDSRENPNTYQTYHTYKKLHADESDVVVYWLELTEKSTGKVIRYNNYK